MGNIDYLKEEKRGGNIVTRVFNGEISKKDIIDSFNHMIESKLLDNNSLGLITVISNSNIKMDMTDLENMVKFMSKTPMISKIKISVVTDNSDQIILPTLVQFKIGDRLRPFNNIKDAKEWITSNKISSY